MRVALYARKSTEQRGDEEAKSVARQISRAREFAAARGWTVDERFVFADDAISGAEKRRPGLLRVLAAIDAKAIDAVIMRDNSRFSRRDGAEAFGELTRIRKNGVRVFFHEDGSEFTYGSFGENVVGFVKAEAAADYRRQIAKWTHDALLHRARNGHVVGGKVFGYDNVRTDAGHVVRRVNETEAAVVLEIFERYAQGQGFKRIAHALNEKGVPTPRAQQGRRNGWDQGTIRAVLLREIYRGLIVWNKTKKRNEDGEQKGQRLRIRPENEIIERSDESLRIISEELAARVDARLAERRQRADTAGAHKSPTRKYLLTGGLLRCACGGNYEVYRWRGTLYYGCSVHRRKGKAICPRALRLPVAETDAAILEVIDRDCLNMERLDRVLALAFANRQTPDRTVLEGERDELKSKIANLRASLQRAMEAGAEFEDIAPMLKERRARLREVERQLSAVENPPDRTELRAAIERKIENWREVLKGAHLNEARTILQQLVGPIAVLSKTYDGDVPADYLPADAAISVWWTADVDPTGVFKEIDEYNRVASLMPASWNQIASWLKQIDNLRQAA